MIPCNHCRRADCRLCWLYAHDAAYRALWDDQPQLPLPAPSPRALPCIHLGDVLDRLDCPCPGKWLRRCGLHQITTLTDCKACHDYEPDG
jgi:hypothetical protein